MQTPPPFPPPRPKLSSESLEGKDEYKLELKEEELVPHKELQELGEVVLRTEIEEFSGRFELEAYREEVEVEHVPVGEVVRERREPWEEDGVLIVPIYEERLVVSKQLVLRERLHIRKTGLTETHLFEDTLRRDKLVMEDPAHTGALREQFPTEGQEAAEAEGGKGTAEAEDKDEGLVERVVRKVMS